MAKVKQSVELSISDAGEHIFLFFDGNSELIDTFNAVCAHMLDLDGDVIVRTNTEIIGVSKQGEFYRFYVSKKDGEYFIKYKDRKECEPFLSSDKEQYFSHNVSCSSFFEENRGRLVSKEAKKETKSRARKERRDTAEHVLEEWSSVKEKAETALSLEAIPSAWIDVSKKVYDEMIELLTTACSDRKVMSERDGDIVISRILHRSSITLQMLGEKYSVTRERIRQREKAAWRKLTNGIYRYTQERFIPYRESLKELLLNIPDEAFLVTIAQIYRYNAMLGMFLQRIVSGANQEDAVSDVLITYVFSNKPQRKSKNSDYKSVASEVVSLAQIESQSKERALLSVVMRDAAFYYYSQLKSNPKAKAAIDTLHSWGIQGKTVIQLGLGFHDNSLNSLLNYMTGQKSHSITQLDEAKLILQSSKGNYCDKMRNSIVIPTIDSNGDVVCFDFYIMDKQKLYRYPNTKHFERSQHLYSYNIAVKSNKKSVIVVTTYEEYFKLIGRGITNVVSTYHPRITEAQLALLKRSFKVIMLIAEQYANPVLCSKYCSENDMYFDPIDLKGCSSVIEYIDQNEQTIVDKINEYERIIN